ncbi:FAD-binding oxidoreductase [Aquimarina sp. 2201CG5-10]|uniref:FAD-binding oxidoreductase n=1 Tax=Aquimarina callyspongiae TaxID=3098150 RepID=UPI002AB5DAB3|nr:FAD-binding oxidoreductase [Aquimarina sp. 2201CG5-10]MDY8135473.1 FAD-binding oxidoreductase [Aquimarina sp. 2201CG5-10]
MIEKILKIVLNEGTLINKREIANNVYHLTIQSTFIQKLKYTPGQHIRVYVGEKSNASGKDNIRTYSIWNIERDLNKIHVAACCHTSGPGSTWVKTVEIGEKVFFSNPKGKFIIDDSFTNYYFIGDNSALAHLYEIRRSLKEDKKMTGIIYSDSLDQLFPDIDKTTPFQFYEFSENPFDTICNLINIDQNSSSVYYVGGDGRLCIELNNYLKRKGLSRKSIKAKPFWMPYKKGLE